MSAVLSYTKEPHAGPGPPAIGYALLFEKYNSNAVVSCLKSPILFVFLAFIRELLVAIKTILASNPIIAMTISSSINVNAFCFIFVYYNLIYLVCTQSAIAKASAASSGFGIFFNLKVCLTMYCTCFLSAFPYPQIADFT